MSTCHRLSDYNPAHDILRSWYRECEMHGLEADVERALAVSPHLPALLQLDEAVFNILHEPKGAKSVSLDTLLRARPERPPTPSAKVGSA